MKKYTTLPTLLGLFAVSVGVIASILLIQLRTEVRVRASSNFTPKDVRITNIDSSSFTVSWMTDLNTLGYVSWGKNSSQENTIHEDYVTLRKTHIVKVDNLDPSSIYQFKIGAGEYIFDNGGISWQTKTAPKASLNSNPVIVSGLVVDKSLKPLANALVYINSGEFAPMSAITSTDGTWFIPLSNARTVDLSKYSLIDSASSADILIESPNGQTSSATILVGNANPLPSITIGNTYDFRSLQFVPVSDTPKRNLLLPEN